MIADSNIFEFKGDNRLTALDLLGDIIPEVGIIFKTAGIVLKELKDREIENKL